MNNIQANTTAAFSGFGIVSGTQGATVQNGSSTWTAAFPELLNMLLGSVQREAQPADAEAYATESTSDVAGSESFRRVGATQSKDATMQSKDATKSMPSSDTDPLAGTFMRSMLAMNVMPAPVQFVTVGGGSTVTGTSWNAVSDTTSVSSSAVESSTSATEVLATPAVPVQKEAISAPKGNVVSLENGRRAEMNSTLTDTTTTGTAANSTNTVIAARTVRATQTAVGNIAFELNLTAAETANGNAAPAESNQSEKAVAAGSALFSNLRFDQGKGEENEGCPSAFHLTSAAYSETAATGAAALTNSGVVAPAFHASPAAIPQAQDSWKESAPVARPAVTVSEKTMRRQAAVREIAFRIGTEQAPVDLSVRTRGGQIHVSVRTSDAGLQASLREDLGTLVKALERSGFDAKAFTNLSTLNMDTLRAPVTTAPYEFSQHANSQDRGARGNSQRESSRESSKDQRQKQNVRRSRADCGEVAA